MNDENSVNAGIRPRRTLTTLKKNVHTKRTVIRIVPISANRAAFLSVMVGVSTLPVSAATPAPAVLGSLSLFESSQDLFQDRSELFGVGFPCSCRGEFFPSFIESLRTITKHSDLLPKWSCSLIV